MEEELIKYVALRDGHLKEVEALAMVLMPDNPHALITYITELRSHCVFLNNVRSEIINLYRQAEFTYKPIKTKETTEFDREVTLKANIKDYEALRLRVDGLIDIIEGHSSMAQSILSFEKSAMGHLNAG